MSSDQPRTPKGFRPAWRDAAREAARRHGMSVDEWLETVVLESAEDDRTAPSHPREPAADVRSGMQAIGSRLDALTRQLDALSPRRTAAPPRPPAAAAEDIAGVLRQLDRRLDTLGSPRPRREPAPPPPHPEPTRDFALDSAIAEIAERQRLLDAGAPPPMPAASPPPAAEPAPAPESAILSRLQGDLRQLTEEIQALRRPDGMEQAVHGLRAELAEIGRQLADAAPRRALQSLEAEMRALAARVDDRRERDGDTAALAQIGQSLDALHAALQRYAPAESLETFRAEVAALDRKIEALVAAAPDAGFTAHALEQLADAIAELREVASHAASGDALVALAEEVQAIGDKVERVGAGAALHRQETFSLLDQRFEELAAHLDARHEAGAPQLARMVEGLADKLDRVELGGASTPVLDAIATQISRLTDHVEAADARLGSFEQFEGTVRQLLDGMEAMRESAVAAEHAAREASLQARAAPAGAEIESLREHLAHLRQSQDASDRRTQDTLEAVHDTLERLVDRLAMVETDMRSARPALVESPPLRPAEPAPANRAPAPEPAPAAAERRALDPTLPADHPLEPGSATRARAGSAAERIAASEAALGPAKPAPEAEAKLNFIAAARRAAQAAATMAEPPAATRDEKPASSFSALAQKFTGRRPLLLALILLISGGALHLLVNGIGSGEAPRAEAPRPPVAAVSAPATALPAAAAPATDSAPTLASEAAEPAPAPTPAAATRSESRATPTVSPLTIASIAIPAGELTASIGRATGIARTPPPAAPAAAAPATPGELPAAFGKGLRSAALEGNPAAEYEIAARYAEGRGVAVNFEEAARWFERAANRGLAPAQYRLGSLYEKGQGVKKDPDQARRLYRAAADKGNAKAAHNLAVLYAEGLDGKPDFRAAAEWFRRAARHGLADSQYNLGILCARGLGIEQSLAESYQWFALAAQQGDQDAAKKRDDVAGRLDAATLASARAAVQSFAAAPQPEEAVSVQAPAGGWEAAAPAAPAKPQRRARPS